MTEEQLELIRFLYQHRQLPAGPAQALAYQALLGEEADQRPPPPREAYDLYQCLDITNRLPSAAQALQELADRDRHWRAVARNWEVLRRNLERETNGTLLHPFPKETNRQLKLISARIFAEEDPEDIDVPQMP